MAVIEIGMTLDDAQKSVQPIPPARYRGILVDWYKDSSGQVVTKTVKTKKNMVKPVFKVQSPEPSYNGRQFIYNAVIGDFSFGELTAAIPTLMIGTGIDTEAALGTEVWLDVSIGTYEGRERNQIDHVLHISAA